MPFWVKSGSKNFSIQHMLSFKVDFVGQPYEGARYYRITRCPI